jgi:small subunit ribosomal protein S5
MRETAYRDRPNLEEMERIKREEALAKWVPKTRLGKEVFEKKITDIDEILKSGNQIKESEIVDQLVPNMKNELILIGGRRGKGGGVQRIPVKITATMHKSGRRFTTNAFVVVGNEDGIVGIAKGSAIESRDSIEKSIKKAKLKIMRIKRGCGHWECSCGQPHTIPFKTEGHSGSVKVQLMPAPKGVGLVADDQSKKIFKLAGIKDIWVKTFGNTSARINLISAIFDALKKLYVYERGE